MESVREYPSHARRRAKIAGPFNSENAVRASTGADAILCMDSEKSRHLTPKAGRSARREGIFFSPLQLHLDHAGRMYFDDFLNRWPSLSK